MPAYPCGAGLSLRCRPIPAVPARAELAAPPQIRQILRKDRYICHSDQRRLSWFDEIEPAYWLVRKGVPTAREGKSKPCLSPGQAPAKPGQAPAKPRLSPCRTMRAFAKIVWLKERFADRLARMRGSLSLRSF